MCMWRAYGDFWSRELRANRGVHPNKLELRWEEICERGAARQSGFLIGPNWGRVRSRGENKSMPRSFAVNHKCFPMAAEVVISLVLVVLMALTFSTRLQAQGPALTTISGTVYRADGTAASGTVISWPSFHTAAGDAVAAGNRSVTIAPLGGSTAQLVPNVGASPAGAYY